MRRILIAFTAILIASTALLPTAVGALAPSVPRSVEATLNGADVVITWVAPESDGGFPIASYEVSVNGGAVQTVAAPTTSLTVVGPAPGSSVSATVTAVNTEPLSSDPEASNTVAVPPVAPSNVVVTIGVETATTVPVSWTADAGGGTNVYDVSISPADATPQIGLTGLSTSFDGLSPNTSYTVTVVARNGVTPNASNTGAATTLFGSAGAPTGVAAALSGVNSTDVTVTWTAPADTGGGLTGYTVRLSNGQSLAAGAGATSIPFTAVGAGSTVTATVQSINGGGPGATSGPSNSVTTADVPGPVSGVTAAWAGAGNINAMTVGWTAPTFAGGTGVSLTGYVVTLSPAIENAIPVVPPGETSVVIGGLEQGTTYQVTVQAQNQLGSSSSVSAAPVRIPTTPGTVTNLVVEQSPPFSSGVILTWDLPTDTGGSPITGYSITVDDRAPLVVSASTVTASFGDLPVGDHNATIRAITDAGSGPAVTSPNFQVKAFPPFDSEEAFVTQLYADFLRRVPDAGGLAFWTARVADDGSNVQDIVESFMRSPEFSPRRAVARLYFAYFNRQPDKGGFDFWTRQIGTGAASLENASQSFALSPEFARTYGSLSDAEFIVLVYNNVLGRRPDQAGFLFWLDQINSGMQRGRMMTLFSESPENIELTRSAVDVTVTYDGMLQRESDAGGFNFWRDQIAGDPNSLSTLIREFYFSPEYAGRISG